MRPPAGATTLAATDLDRTLLHSDRAAGPAPAAEVVRLERRGEVATASLLRGTAAALVALEQRATWLPVTTRSVAQYRRLGLGPRLGLAPRHVACANGGVLLVDGVPDATWAARMARVLAAAAPRAEVAELLAGRLALLPPGSAGPVRDADGVLLVVRVRCPPTWLDELVDRCGARGWRVAVHGEKLHLLPAPLTKVAAAEEVRRRVGATRLLAAGDSPLDAELLLAADAGIQPVDGRLHAEGWRAPHVAVTAGSGLRAGEEIAGWLAAQAGGGGSTAT